MEYAKLIIGLITLLLSGEFLVKGAVGIAIRLRISTLVIGMTIVSFGTSAPELLVAIKAAIKEKPDIALGAVIGSNISNIALVLGLTALVFPISVNRDTIGIDWPVMMIATLVFYVMILNGTLSFWEGFLLFVMIVSFTTWLIRRSRKNNPPPKESTGESRKTIGFFYLKNIALIMIGCIGLAYGADWFVDGADDIAMNFGISQRIIGLTVVALGTSMPELITSLVAAFRKQLDISVGNLIGSNVFNILSILGVTSMIKEIPVMEDLIRIDSLWMIGISILIFPIMLIGRKISRLEGLILVLVYLAYLYFIL